MQFRLRTLLIVLAVAPPLLAAAWFAQSIRGFFSTIILVAAFWLGIRVRRALNLPRKNLRTS